MAHGRTDEQVAENASPDSLWRSEAIRTGLSALSLITLGSATFEESLTRVAQLATQSIPGAHGAGITFINNHHQRVAVATAAFVHEIETLQYDQGEGPGFSSVAEDRVVLSGSLTSDRRWPQFAGRMANLGVNRAQSILSLPLRIPGKTIGSLSIYGRAENSFDEDLQRRADLFATYAAVAVWNMQQLHRAQETADQIEASRPSRETISQAMGIIRSRSGGSGEEAFDVLRTVSQRENVKLASVAAKLVDEAIHRAHARSARSIAS